MPAPTPTPPTANENAFAEQRSSDRNPYAYYQMIAPIFGDRFPSEIEFFEVECHDIATGGFAFFAEGRPPFETLVVRLGRPPALKHVRARVANVTEVDYCGTTAYRVGCRFIDRIKP